MTDSNFSSFSLSTDVRTKMAKNAGEQSEAEQLLIMLSSFVGSFSALCEGALRKSVNTD
jgi:hypothetical protein